MRVGGKLRGVARGGGSLPGTVMECVQSGGASGWVFFIVVLPLHIMNYELCRLSEQ